MSFRTPDYTLGVRPFDLSKHFNIDVIENPGDKLNGTVDGGWASFVVDGYDGTSTPNRNVRGLPRDRFIGVHRLGDYNQDNAIQLVEKDGSLIRVEVPPRRYTAVRFLVTCGWGRAVRSHVLHLRGRHLPGARTLGVRLGDQGQRTERE